MTRLVLPGLACLAALTAAVPALAHPHVWVTARTEIAYAADGKVTGVRHAWTFDAAYSAYITQGLDQNKDGKLSPDELQELAKTNAESLAEFEYFTVLKANGVTQAFAGPRDHRMTFEDGAVTLHFNLPLKAPAAATKVLALEIYDPTYFVEFSLAEGDDAVRLADAPKGCGKTVMRPKPLDVAQQQKLSEAFFEALNGAAAIGAQFSNRVLVACP